MTTLIMKQAPLFTCKNADGETKTLSSYLGSWLVLYCYPKDDTSGCTLEGIQFTEKISTFKKHNAVIVGVSPDDEKSHCKFRMKHALGIELLSDPEHTLLTAYDVWKEKSMYGRKYMGVERSTFLIDPKGMLVKAWRKVSVPGHVDEVLKTLLELQSKQ